MSNNYVFQELYQTLQKKNVDNPPYGKRWRLYIFPQFLSNLTRPITHKVIFWEAKFVPVIATWPILGFPRFSVRFYEQFNGFHELRTVGKSTSRHLFRYGGLRCVFQIFFKFVHPCRLLYLMSYFMF